MTININKDNLSELQEYVNKITKINDDLQKENKKLLTSIKINQEQAFIEFNKCCEKVAELRKEIDKNWELKEENKKYKKVLQGIKDFIGDDDGNEILLKISEVLE